MKRLRVVQIGICHEHANDKIDTLVARLEGRDAAFPATFGPTFVKGETL